MGDSIPPSEAPQKATKPRLLFKRQAAKRQVSAEVDLTLPLPAEEDKDEDGLALFQRSKDYFARAIEEQEQQEKAQFAGPHNGRSNVQSPTTADGGSDHHKVKRIKLSEATADDEDIYGVSDREEKRRASLSASRSSEPATPPASRKPQDPVLSPPVSNPIPRASKGKGLASPYSLASKGKATPATPIGSAASIIISDEEDDQATGPRIRISPQRRRADTSTPTNAVTIDIDVPHADPFAEEASDPDDDIEEVTNPEFQEYILRARARNAAAQAQKATQRNSPRPAHGADDDDDDNNTTTTNDLLSPERSGPGSGPATGTTTTPDPGDPIICILLTSRLPHAEDMAPLIVKRRLSQNMKAVRDMYISRLRAKGYELAAGAAAADAIFLTWKGHKIYNSTTGHSLQLGTNARGKIRRVNGQPVHEDEPGLRGGKLHFEAWTEESYKAYLDERERERLRHLGEMSDEDSDLSGGEDGEGQQQQEAEEESKIRLTLKSRDYEPVRLTAHPETTVATMLGIFRTQRGVGEEHAVSLFWDGEKLDLESTVADVEMEDMDTVEVHVVN